MPPQQVNSQLNQPQQFIKNVQIIELNIIGCKKSWEEPSICPTYETTNNFNKTSTLLSSRVLLSNVNTAAMVHFSLIESIFYQIANLGIFNIKPNQHYLLEIHIT